MRKIGVLALQGDFQEHISMLQRLGAEATPVRLPQQLEGLEGLIIPGGESTTISKLMIEYKMRDQIRELSLGGLPLFGTCAGMVLLARRATGLEVEPLGAMNIDVRRNAFGRQVDSFETDLSIPALGSDPFPAVFIRAPWIEQTGNGVQCLARLEDGTAVAAREGSKIACAFHPELTDDTRFHQYFLDIVADHGQSKAG